MAALTPNGSLSTTCHVGLKWTLHLLAFEARRKPEYPTSNLTHVWRRYRELNGCSGWRRVLSPPRHPCYPCFALANQIDQEVPITQSEAEADTCSWCKAAKGGKILDYMSDFFLLSNYPMDAIL